MPVSQKQTIAGKAQNVKIGEVTVTVPLLADCAEFIQSPQVADEKGAPAVDADGLPIYADARANWLQSAIFAYVKSGARNKLAPNSADVKPGLVIPSNWDEFTAESGGNGTDALAIIREARAAFAAWISTQGKSEKVMQALTLLFANPKALMIQGEGQKAKFAEFLDAFSESLTPDQMARFARPLTQLAEACATDADDWSAE